MSEQTNGTQQVNGWTAERRARQAEAIRRWQPWTRSTGPRTPRGKAKVAKNPYRGGMRPFLRALSAAMDKYIKCEALLAEARSRAPVKRQRAKQERFRLPKPPLIPSPFRMKPYAGLGHLSKSENLKIKAGVARAIEAGKPPLTAALQAMKDAWGIGGPIAAARFAKLCLRHCHERPKRIAFAEDTLRALHETPMDASTVR